MTSLGRLFRLFILTRGVQEARAHLRDTEKNEKVGRILSIENFGAIPDDPASTVRTFHEFEEEGTYKENSSHHLQSWNAEVAMNNTNAFNLALTEAQSGDTVLVPDGKSFVMFGSVLANNKHNIAIDIAGSAHFVHDRNIWPYGTVPWSSSFSKRSFDPGITVYNCTSITLTSSSVKRARVQVDYKKNGVYLVNAKEYSGGILNGNGKGWWDDVISGRLPAEQGDSRPRLVLIMESEDVLVENLTLLNSPFWSLTVEAVNAEVRHVNVLVDRKYQATLFERVGTTVEYERALEGLEFPFPIDDLPDWIGRKFHQPQDLNTDGIDPKGKNIWIHDCIIQNADDSVAVKPLYSGRDINSRIPDCTRNITVENMVMTGFGASIGSVHPRETHSCIDDVTFRNISMPGTGKGIYIKSDGSDCHNVTGQITNILYENVRMFNPFWWSIWIGPQQQHQPKSKIGLKCSLTWPIEPHCPSPGCVHFENITLREIYIHEPVISPGVIMGNETNPIKNLVIEGLHVTENKYKPWLGKWPFHEKRYPWRGKIQCIHAYGTYNNSDPVPKCLSPQ